jgi:hypothetical protein
VTDSKKPTVSYLRWDEPAFWADRVVASRMTTHQRHLYRALLLAALWCPTRPDLPNDDNELYLLADADDVADWQKNKAPILTKFHEDEVDGAKVLYNNRLRKEWAVFEEAHDKWQGQAEAKKSKLSARAKKGADARWKNAKDASSIARDATGTLGMPLKDTETKPTENSHSNQKREQPEPDPAGAQASGSGSPANASHSTNPSDSGSGFSAQDRAEVDQLLGNTAGTMKEQAEAKEKLGSLFFEIFPGIRSFETSDMTALLRRDNPQLVLDVVQWAWEKSDYWFKQEKGMVKNAAALYNAYPPMKQSYLSYWQTAKDRLEARKGKKAGAR